MSPQRHPVFGVAVPDLGWVPAPSYLLRRDRVLRVLRSMRPGVTLEVGCGAGALIDDLLRLGHSCHAIETSPDARRLAMTIHEHNPNAQVHAEAPSTWHDTFDYILAFEVLEHIEDDRKALLQWGKWLKADGHLLMSVPAHSRRWSASDEWAGHFRRYEREDLKRLLEQTGFAMTAIECYGFPLANAIEPVRAWLHRRALRSQRIGAEPHHDRASNSSRSGIERTFESRLYPLQSGVIGTTIMRLSFALQSIFVRTELGTGYLVLAQKR